MIQKDRDPVLQTKLFQIGNQSFQCSFDHQEIENAIAYFAVGMILTRMLFRAFLSSVILFPFILLQLEGLRKSFSTTPINVPELLIFVFYFLKFKFKDFFKLNLKNYRVEELISSLYISNLFIKALKLDV